MITKKRIGYAIIAGVFSVLFLIGWALLGLALTAGVYALVLVLYAIIYYAVGLTMSDEEE